MRDEIQSESGRGKKTRRDALSFIRYISASEMSMKREPTNHDPVHYDALSPIHHTEHLLVQTDLLRTQMAINTQTRDLEILSVLPLFRQTLEIDTDPDFKKVGRLCEELVRE